MPELDSLELKVEADAKKADSALDSLIEKLQNLSKTLGGVNTNNIKNIASAINGATNSNGIKVAQKSVDNLNKSIKNIGKGTKSKDIEIIRTDGAIKNLSGFENALKEFDSFIEESGNKVSKNGFLDTPLQNLKENLAQLKKQFPEAKELIQSYQEEIKMIQNMQAKSASTGNAQKLSGYSIENAQKTLNAALGKSIPSATTKSVSGMTTKLSGLKTALSSVAKTASANMFNNFSNGINKAKTALSGYIKNAIRSINVSKGFKSIVGHVRNLYFSFLSLRAVGGILKKSITSAMDYIEEFNYFQNAIGKIASENKGDYKKYGYTDAESYADSFQSRLTSLSSKMTGFDISKNGELSNSGKQSLGLDVTEVTNFQSRIAQMTNSVGMFGEASIVSAKALTMLAGDMSSLTNVDLSTVMNNFSSGLSGMSMALKKYGIDITNASLKQLALSLGVKKNISDMTQAEKEYLRVIAMVQQSKVSWGDLANTINQPANQFRMLKTNISQCGMMLGRLFMPMVAKVLPWLNAMTGAIKDLIQHIGDLFGIKWANSKKMNAGTDDSGYTDIADSADNAADSIGNATDKQKEFNKQLQGFDKLNNLTSSKDSGNKKGNGSGSGADVSGQLSDALIKAVEGYEKRWNKAFNGMSNKSDELKKKIEDLFKGAWLTNDGTEIGKAVANVLNKGINWVNSNTSTWTSGLKKIATIMGTALNGFVSTFNWDGLGKAIGNSIKGALEATQTFFDTVDWTNLGKGISKTLNAAIKTGVIQQYLKTAASVLKSAIETAFGAITTFDFAGLGNAIGQGINDFISKMNEINKKTGLNGWQELGKSISSGISGIVTTITTALKKVKWQKVGDAIGEFISSIDFKKVALDMGKLAKELLNAIAKSIKGIVDKAPIESAIAALFVGLKLAGVGKAITTALNGKNITLGRILVGLTLTAATFKFFNSDNILTSAFLTPILAFIAAKTFGIATPLALKILALTAAVSFGFNFGKLIGTAISKATANTDMDQYRYNFKFSDLFTYSPTEWIKGFMDWFNDTKLKAGLQKVLSGNLKLKLPISGFSFPTRSEQMTILLNYWTAAKKLWGNKKLIIKSSITMAQSLFTGAWKTAKKLWGDKKLNIKGSIDMRKPLFLNAWEVAKKFWGNKKLVMKTILSIDEVKTGIKAMVKLVNAMIIDPINAITNVKLPKALGGGRILPKLKRIPVPKFENGGYPNKANLFWANEYGKPELVGRQGSKTVVANNDQIIKGVSEGVSDAVYNAMNPVLTGLAIAVNKMNESKNGNALYVEGVSDGDIVKIVKAENDQYKRTHNGNPLFA
nr:MAG TPA: minor tail protein [Bacteriophage sp.]